MSDDKNDLFYKSMEMREGFSRTMFAAPDERDHKPMDPRRAQEIMDKGLSERVEKMLFRVEDALRNGPGA